MQSTHALCHQFCSTLQGQMNSLLSPCLGPEFLWKKRLVHVLPIVLSCDVDADVVVDGELSSSVVHPCCLWWCFCVVVEESSSVSDNVATWRCCSTAATLGLKSAASAAESSGAEPPSSSAAESAKPAEGFQVAADNWGWLVGFEGPERSLCKAPLCRFLSSSSFFVFFALCGTRMHTEKLLA